MWIEALCSLTIRKKNGVVCLRSGQLAEFEFEEGWQLLERAAGKVKVAVPPVAVGQVVTVASMTGPAWKGRVTEVVVESTGGTAKAGWWLSVMNHSRWSWVHYTLIQPLVTE